MHEDLVTVINREIDEIGDGTAYASTKAKERDERASIDS